MANTALKKITTAAKKLRKKKPGMSWKSAVKAAGASYRSAKKSPRKRVARKAAPKKRVVKKRVVKKAAPRKRAKTFKRGKAVKKRVYAAAKYSRGTYKPAVRIGSVKRRKRVVKRKITRRRVGSAGMSTGTKLAIGALVLGGLYMMSRKQEPRYYYPPSGNPVRDNKAQQIMNYVLAAGATATQIANLIAALNQRSEQELDNDLNAIQQGTMPQYFV
jgi:hypothetical protein